MAKLILLLAILGITFGCSNNGNSSNQNNKSSEITIPDLPINAILLTNQNAISVKNTVLQLLPWLLGASDGSLDPRLYGCISATGANPSIDFAGTTILTFLDCPFLVFNAGDSVNGELNFTFNAIGSGKEKYWLDGYWKITGASSEVTDIVGVDVYTTADFTSGPLVIRTSSLAFAYSNPTIGGFVVATDLPITRPVTTGVNSGEVIIMGSAGSRLKYEYGTNNLYLDNGSGVFVQL